MKKFLRIKSITDLHGFLGYEKPRHPLVSIVDYSKVVYRQDAIEDVSVVNDFYLVSLKDTAPNELLYGRNYYDFSEGSMFFMSPNQVFEVGPQESGVIEGWGLYFHPDLISGTSFYGQIGEYGFFNYSNSEALHLSEKERLQIERITENIKTEIDGNLDRHSQEVIVSNIQLLLNYCKRFYERQFLTRTKHNKDIISEFELLLKAYYQKEMQLEEGLINVNYFAQELHLSKSYLSDLIKRETGKTIKENIHIYIIEMAKNELLSTSTSINEVAYSLGFEYPQYFSRLFKAKVGMTPVEYRNMN